MTLNVGAQTNSNAVLPPDSSITSEVQRGSSLPSDVQRGSSLPSEVQIGSSLPTEVFRGPSGSTTSSTGSSTGSTTSGFNVRPTPSTSVSPSGPLNNSSNDLLNNGTTIEDPVTTNPPRPRARVPNRIGEQRNPFFSPPIPQVIPPVNNTR